MVCRCVPGLPSRYCDFFHLEGRGWTGIFTGEDKDLNYSSVLFSEMEWVSREEPTLMFYDQCGGQTARGGAVPS